MSILRQDFLLVSLIDVAEKHRYVVHVNGSREFVYDQIDAVFASIAYKDHLATIKIVREHWCNEEWFPVAHYLYDRRRCKLQALREQRVRLNAEIAELEKELRQ